MEWRVRIERLWSHTAWKAAAAVLACAAFVVYGIVKINGSLAWESDYFHGVVLVCGFLGIGCTALACYAYYKKQWDLTRIYPAAALVMSLAYCLMLPTYTHFDEDTHFDAAYEVSNYLMGQEVGTGEWSFLINRRVCDYIYGDDAYEVYTAEQFNKFGAGFLTDEAGRKILLCYNNASEKHGIAYIVPALGITLGRLLHLGFSSLSVMGAMLHAVFFILVTTYSMRKLPIGRKTLFVIALSPMTIQQAASFSYDCPINAAAIVTVSIAVCWLYRETPASIRQLPKLAAADEVLMLLGSAVILWSLKGKAYACLLLLPVLAFLSKLPLSVRGRRMMVAGFLVLLSAGAAYYVLSGRLGVLMEGFKNTPPAPLYEGSNCQSVYYYMTHPLELLRIYANTLVVLMKFLLSGMLGGYMGISTIVRQIWKGVALLLLLSVAAEEGEDVRLWKTPFRIWAVLLSLFSVALVMAAMLFYWTPDYYAYIVGLQGRYFIPMLLPVLLAVGYWGKIRAKGWISEVAVLAAPVLATATMMLTLTAAA